MRAISKTPDEFTFTETKKNLRDVNHHILMQKNEKKFFLRKNNFMPSILHFYFIFLQKFSKRSCDDKFAP